MRRAMSMALAGWFAITMTLAQSCAGPAQGGAPYRNLAPRPAPLGTTSSGSGGVGATAGGGGAANAHLDTTGYTADQASSQALSDYLKHRRLPLVGAQVLKSPAGQRVVVLYGFVGSDFGKHDAVAKTQNYLADSNVPVDNRIKVRPELLSAGGTGGAPGASSADEAAAGAPDASQQYPGISSYEQQPSQAPQYVQQQNAGAAMSTVVPLLMLGLMALSMTSGGAFAVGPGSFGSMGGSPFGPPPYNPYPGYPSPSPYGGGVTPYGGAGSPYTSAPPTNPFGP